MGRPKLALPLGDRTVLGHVLVAFKEAGVDHTLVVLGPHVRDLAAVAVAAGACTLLLAEPTPDMRATVEHGLRWVQERLRPTLADDWLLVPADHPALRAEVVKHLLDARQTHFEQTIFIPTHGGRRGHPTLLAWEHAAAIQAQPAGERLNAYIRGRSEVTMEVPVEDPAIHWDLDTPEDYERLLREYR
jgi:molybdenum cofactor cytidylyltransferase